MAYYSDDEEYETIHYKAPDQDRDANVYHDNRGEPAYALVGARREKRHQGENPDDILLPIGQESTVNGF